MDIFALIESKAHNGAFGMNAKALPTLAQIKAGNYAKGKFTLHGLPIVVEQPRNSIRTGVSKDGKQWQSRMAAHYGYIQGSKGADGDQIDVFIGATPENTMAYVINQNNEQGDFDEHKVMIGFNDADDAKRAYLESYERNWTGFGNMLPVTIEQLKWWLKNGNTKVAITPNSLPYDGNNDMNTFDSIPVAKHLYDLRVSDTENLLLDSATPEYILDDADGLVALDAMVIPYATMEKKVAQLQRIMEGAAGEVKPIASQVTQPFKKNGTVNVAAIFEMDDGQTVSILFHNPDTTPNKLTPQDEMVSWKWMLNKKDVTIVVAPEKGKDLNPREVATRIMKLVQANSARFGKANAAKQARMANIEAMQKQVEAKTAELAQLEAEIEKRKAGGGSAVGGEQSGGNIDSIIANMRTIVTDSPMVYDTEQDQHSKYVVMRATRPLVGTETMEANGIMGGGFWALIDRNDEFAANNAETNKKLDATIHVAVKNEDELNKVALYFVKDGKYFDRYVESISQENYNEAIVEQLKTVAFKEERTYSEMMQAIEWAKSFNAEQPQSGDSELLQKALAQFPELKQYNVGALWFEGDELQSRSDYDIPQDLFARVEAFLSGKGGSRVDTESLEQQLKQAFPDASTSWSNSTVSLLWELPNDITAGVSFETLQDFPTVDMGVQKYRYESRSEDLLKVVGQSIKDASIETLMAVTQKFYNEQVKPVQGGEQALTDDDFIGSIQGVLAGKGWTKDGSLIANSPDGNFMVDFTDRTKTGEVAYATVNTYDGNAWVAVGRTIEFGRFDKAKKTPEQVVQAIEAVIAENAPKEDATPAVDDKVQATLNSAEFKNTFADILRSIGVIAGIDNGTQRGYDRALFVNSIVGKIKTRAKNNQLLGQLLLAKLFVAQKAMPKPAVTMRNSVWNVAQDWEQYTSLFEKPQEAQPEPQSETNPDIAKVDAAYQFNASDDFKAWVAKSVELDDYSPFLSAKTIDEAVKAKGGTVEWGFYGKPVMDSVTALLNKHRNRFIFDNAETEGNEYVGKIMLGGKVIGRVDIADDGKAMIFVGEKGGTRVTYNDGSMGRYSNWDSTLKDYVSVLFAGLGQQQPTEQPAPVEPQSLPSGSVYKVESAQYLKQNYGDKAGVTLKKNDGSEEFVIKDSEKAAKMLTTKAMKSGDYKGWSIDVFSQVSDYHKAANILTKLGVNVIDQMPPYLDGILTVGKSYTVIKDGESPLYNMEYIGLMPDYRSTNGEVRAKFNGGWSYSIEEVKSLFEQGRIVEYKELDNQSELIDEHIRQYNNLAEELALLKQSIDFSVITDENSAQELRVQIIVKSRDIQARAPKFTDEEFAKINSSEKARLFAGQERFNEIASYFGYGLTKDIQDAFAKAQKQKAESMQLSPNSSINEVISYYLAKNGTTWGSDAVNRYIEEYESRNVASLASRLGNKDNKASREIFEHLTGIKLESTQKGVKAQIEEWANNQPAPQQEDTALTEAKAFLQSVIDGNVDFMDTEFADKLLSYEQYTELSDMFAQAAQAYADWAVKEAQAALANM